MSSFNRLFGLAAKALDSSNSSSSSHGRGRDWRDMVRDVAGAVTGDGRPAAAGQQGRQPGAQTHAGAQTYPGAQPYPGAPGAAAATAYPGANGHTPPSAAGVGLTPPPFGAAGAPAASTPGAPSAADRAAIARYEYLLQTADPHQVEAIHREAFARLTPEQRAQVQAGMRSELRPTEQPRSAEAPDLARAAARTEAMRPGTMAGLLARVGRGRGGRAGSGLGRGAALVGAGGLLGAVAGGAVVSAVAAPLLASAAASGIDFDAIAGSLDLDALAGGVDLGSAGDLVAGAGETVSGFGEQLSNFEIPGLGDLFGR